MYRIEHFKCSHDFVEILKTLESSVIRIRDVAQGVANAEKFNRYFHFVNCMVSKHNTYEGTTTCSAVSARLANENRC